MRLAPSQAGGKAASGMTNGVGGGNSLVAMCGPHFCSMKITQDVRNYAEQKGLEEAEALKIGMEEKSKQFLEEGAAIYHEV